MYIHIQYIICNCMCIEYMSICYILFALCHASTFYNFDQPKFLKFCCQRHPTTSNSSKSQPLRLQSGFVNCSSTWLFATATWRFSLGCTSHKEGPFLPVNWADLRVKCPPFAPDSPGSLTSSESIAGNTGQATLPCPPVSAHDPVSPSLTISSGLLATQCGRPYGSLVGLLLVNEMLRHFLLHHLGNLARLLEMRLGLSIETDTKKRKGWKKEAQIEILRGTCCKIVESADTRVQIHPQSCCAVLACSRSAWPTSSVQLINSRTMAYWMAVLSSLRTSAGHPISGLVPLGEQADLLLPSQHTKKQPQCRLMMHIAITSSSATK